MALFSTTPPPKRAKEKNVAFRKVGLPLIDRPKTAEVSPSAMSASTDLRSADSRPSSVLPSGDMRHFGGSRLPRRTAGLGGPGSSGLFSQRMGKRMQPMKVLVADCTDDGTPTLPLPLRSGIMKAAEFFNIEFLYEKGVLNADPDTKVHLHQEQVRDLYQARCDDQGVESTWERFVRFVEILGRLCVGHKVGLTECGLKVRSALVLADILTNNDHYTVLDLSGNCIRDEGAERIAQLLETNTSLVHLSLRSNNICSAGGTALAKALCNGSNRTLTSLDLSGITGINRNLLGFQAAHWFANVLKTNSVLTALNLASCALGTKGSIYIAEGLGHNSTLQHLDLSRNGVTSEACGLICKALESTAQLRTLNLSWNKLRDAGIQVLAKGLTEYVSATLTELDVCDNGISSVGLTDLANAFAAGCPLLTLRLDSNPLTLDTKAEQDGLLRRDTVEGLKGLVEALSRNKTLTHLSMKSCGFKSSSGAVLSELWDSSLQHVVLSQNRLGVEGGTLLLEGLSRNTTLVSLDIADIGMGAAVMRRVAHVLIENNTLQSLRITQNGASGGVDELVQAMKTNTSLTSIDVRSQELRSLLQQNQLRWKAGKGERYKQKIMLMTENSTQLTDTIAAIHSVHRERERQAEILKLLQHQHQQVIADLRSEMVALQRQLEDNEVICQETKAELEAYQADLGKKIKSLDSKKAKAMNAISSDAQKIKQIEKDIEKAQAKITAYKRETVDIVEAEEARLRQAELERQVMREKATVLGSTLTELELKLKMHEPKRKLSTAELKPKKRSMKR